MPSPASLLASSSRGPVAGVVAVVGDQHPLGAVRLEGLEVVRGEALDAVARGHVAEAGAPEGQRVDQRLAEDDLLRSTEGVEVEDAAVRAGQVEVVGACRSRRSWRDLAAVDLDDVAPARRRPG